MFVWRASTLLAAVAAFAPDTAALVQRVVAGDARAWESIENLSID
jgi:hypothetical protein